MPLYEKCTDDAVLDAAAQVIHLYHARLADVRLDFLWVRSALDDNGDPVEPDPLKWHGYPCLAVVKIIGPKDRAMGRADAEISLDFKRWEELSDEQRLALLDHELSHLELTGKTDDHGRPKLKMRLHDVQAGWFVGVAERHGAASQEVQQAQEIAREHGAALLQGEFDFRHEPSGDPGGGTMTLATGGKSVTITSADAARMVENVDRHLAGTR